MVSTSKLSNIFSITSVFHSFCTGSISELTLVPNNASGRGDNTLGECFQGSQLSSQIYRKQVLKSSLIRVPISRNESSPAVMPSVTEGVMLVRAKQLVAILAITLPLATLMLGLFVYCVRRKLRMTSKGEDLGQLDLGMTIKSENSELLEENKR